MIYSCSICMRILSLPFKVAGYLGKQVFKVLSLG